MAALKYYLSATVLSAATFACLGCDRAADSLAPAIDSTVVLPTNEVLPAQPEPVAAEEPTSFTVLTYNVENLFDVDGVAMFNDYRQGAEDGAGNYSRAKFLTKLQTIATVLSAINEGTGPEVILFQELEADVTPETDVVDYSVFLEEHSDHTVRDMLGQAWSPSYAGLPASAWLLKALADHGLTGYHVATVPSPGLDSGIAHTNAVFSKFPITRVARYPLVQARAIIEAELDVEGRPLLVYVNHWKSGASSPEREPIRVENARVLRSLLDQRLAADPDADVLIAGDLNSHYNQSLLFPKIETGINDVLGSAGDESFGENDLYNLWFELPVEARFSEVWRGRRGTLMHMLLTPGMYDTSGINYVDGSFGKLVLPGLNADAIGRPLEWHASGTTGGGASDHFPVYARFTTAPFEATGDWSTGDDALNYELPLIVTPENIPPNLPDAASLNGLDDDALAPYVAQLFYAEATILSIRPLRLQVDQQVWPAYYVDPAMIEEGGLPDYVKTGSGRVRLVVHLGYYKGNAQLVVESILGSW